MQKKEVGFLAFKDNPSAEIHMMDKSTPVDNHSEANPATSSGVAPSNSEASASNGASNVSLRPGGGSSVSLRPGGGVSLRPGGGVSLRPGGPSLSAGAVRQAAPSKAQQVRARKTVLQVEGIHSSQGYQLLQESRLFRVGNGCFLSIALACAIQLPFTTPPSLLKYLGKAILQKGAMARAIYHDDLPTICGVRVVACGLVWRG